MALSGVWKATVLLNKKVAMRKLLEAYCTNQNLQMKIVTFRYNDKVLKLTDTAEALNMQDGDNIQVYFKVEVKFYQ
ncbi:MAG: hypothetical protein EZS28_030665 [Streblomastix strix]|uniref:Rad60/SUMO-like domain-containing protein n=1 Tax=Streblomastix strix TaxID=222440 RepID=A0A5J4UTN7_9EUKA|nr:MAG: hypothetical protein EZS28_030665 [Streblomastix strix]